MNEVLPCAKLFFKDKITTCCYGRALCSEFPTEYLVYLFAIVKMATSASSSMFLAIPSATSPDTKHTTGQAPTLHGRADFNHQNPFLASNSSLRLQYTCKYNAFLHAIISAHFFFAQSDTVASDIMHLASNRFLCSFRKSRPAMSSKSITLVKLIEMYDRSMKLR
jgi:hypothetical protein